MPLELVTRVLEQRGALVERLEADHAQALLPPELAAELDLGEVLELSEDGAPGTTSTAHASPLLRAAIAWATAGRARAAARASFTPPRPGPPSAYSGLNVALRPGAPTPSKAWTVTAHFRVDAVADDRRLLHVAASALLDDPVPLPALDWTGVTLDPLPALPAAARLAACAAPLRWEAERAALVALAPFREVVARRWRRNLERIDRYFAELDADLARRARARGAAGLERKRELLPAERARRVATLRENSLLRVRLDPVALLAVEAAVASAPLEVRRRDARRTLTVRFHPALRAWLPLACEGCGAPTRAIGACDAAVHVLCAACLEAHGPRRCPRCARGGPPVPSAGPLLLEASEEPGLAPPLDPASPLARALDEGGAAAPAERAAPAVVALGPAEHGPPAGAPTRAGAPSSEASAPAGGRRRARAASGSTKRDASATDARAPRRGGARRRADETARATPPPPPARDPATDPAEAALERLIAALGAPGPAPRPAEGAATDPAEAALVRLIAALEATDAAQSSQELQLATGLDVELQRSLLRRLVGEGRVERTGKARGTRYRWLG